MDKNLSISDDNMAKENEQRFLSQPRIKSLIFSAGIIFYLVIQLLVYQLPVIVDRVAPKEVDDAYVYMNKAEQMKSCFFQDCPALNDLREQFKPGKDDLDTEWIRFVAHKGFFLVYHPLHSAILLGFNMTGLSYEQSYSLMSLLGTIFFCMAIAYWLKALFGAAPAGLAMFLMAFEFFPVQGLHYVVPSNLTLGIAFLLWGAILKRKRSLSILFSVYVLAMLLTHPVGRIYSLMGVAMYLLTVKKGDLKHAGIVVIMPMVLVALAFVLHRFVDRPELVISGGPVDSGWSYRIGLFGNIQHAMGTCWRWFVYSGGYLLVSGMVIVGSLSLQSEKRKVALKVLAVLIFFTAGALLYVFPRFSGDLFDRMWIALAVFLTGAMGMAVWWVIKYLTGSSFFKYLNDFNDKIFSRKLILTLIAVFIVSGYSVRCWYGYKDIQEMKEYGIAARDPFFDQSQPEKLLACSEKEDAVLYLDEIPMYFFLTKGCFNRGSVFYPAVKNTSAEKGWVRDNSALRFVVAWNPAEKLSEKGYGLSEGESIVFKGDFFRDKKNIYLCFGSGGKGALVEIIPEYASKSSHKINLFTTIKGKTPKWYEVELSDEEDTLGVKITVVKSNKKLRIYGIRIDPQATANWIWDEGITMTYVPVTSVRGNVSVKPEIPTSSVNFETSLICPEGIGPIKVLDDSGSTVMFEIKKQDQ